MVSLDAQSPARSGRATLDPLRCLAGVCVEVVD